MEKHEILPVLEEVSAYVADFTVGFAIVRTYDGIQDAYPAGSGSLVTVGSVHGILTAAHVLKELPDKGEVGLVRFPRVQRFAEKLTIDMEHVDKLTIGAAPFGAEGPDLGFLRLWPEVLGTLKARGNAFFNLWKRRKSVLCGDHPDLRCFDGLSGMIAEWTTDLPPEERGTRKKRFRALFGVGMVIGKRESNGFDLFDFEVTYGQSSVSPDSFEGMSGGALWRVYCTKDDNGQTSMAEKKMFGVAFHQSDLSDQKRIITCHGPRSVYGPLIEAIREKWPE